MATRLEVANTDLSMFYKFTLPDGRILSVQVTRLTEEICDEVVTDASVNYVLVTPLRPRGLPTNFLQGYKPQAAYVRTHTALNDPEADLLAWMLPYLTYWAPAGELEQEADRWFYTRYPILTQEESQSQEAQS